MDNLQFATTNSPFNEEQTDLLNQLLPTLNESQKYWLSGYLAYSGASVSEAAATVDVEAPVRPEEAQASSQQAETRDITVLIGTQTGNCESLGKEFSEKLKQQDLSVTLLDMDQFKPKNIKNVEDLFIITSTHGEGDPPDNSLGLYDFLHSRRAPKLDNVRYSVLALGDTSYEQFCQTGKEFDHRLAELGGERLHERVDCDVDYEEPAASWFSGVIAELQKNGAAETVPEKTPDTDSAAVETPGQPIYSKKNPFKAEILENINLNGRGSNKETRHLELNLEGSNFVYEPGDSLAIAPENDPELVNQLIEDMNWDPAETITVNKEGGVLPLREALTKTYDITTLTKSLLQKAAGLIDDEKLTNLLLPENKEELKTYIEGRDLVDFVKDFGPWNVSVGDFTGILRKIPVRLYSIASSLEANPEEVHLTVGAVRYDAHGRSRKGVCSVQCAERSSIGDHLSVFVQPNKSFKLPEDHTTPIIMIGAGTGIAPYRSFLEEREEAEAEGKSWLFFGDQHFMTDFLYQTELQRWRTDGVLTKMNVAFSRDTAEKIYVQHRLLEEAKEIYSWIESGANIYVCGDKQYMAKDVHEALLTIIEKEGGKSREEAETYLADMRKAKQYQRDVY